MSTMGSGSGHSPTRPRWVSAIWPSVHQADVGAGAADIDGDDVADAAAAAATSRAPTTPAAGPDSAVSAGARPIAAAPATPPFDCISSRGAAMPASVSRRRQASNIARDRRHHPGVQDRGQAALVFAHDRQHIHRGGDRDLGQRRAQDLGDAAFMGGIGEGVQQADRDGLHVEPPQRRRGVAHAGLVERMQHRAAGADALDRPPARARGEPGGAASPRRTGWPRAGCPGGRSPAHGGSRRWSPGRCGRSCLPGSGWWRPWCRAARGRWRRGRAPAASSASRTPAMKASRGSAGVLGVLARQIRPVAASARVMSVKVPPISTATERVTAELGRGSPSSLPSSRLTR